MHKGIASLGIILVLIGAVMFYIVFSGGSLAGLVVTGTNSLANFMAFLYVIVALPVGCSLAYAGLAFRAPIYAAGGQAQVSTRGSSMAGAGLAIGIIALIIGFAAIGVAFSYHPVSGSAVTSLSSQVSSLNSEVSSLKTAGGSNLATMNQQPSTVAEKIDWCNADNTGQDRYCPANFVVVQGDIVQILFISNDTDIHTFTLDTSPYSFQINLSATGMHDFLTNGFASGSCLNTGTPAQQTSAISGAYCVSGSSLLTPSQLQSNGATDYVVAQNPSPANPLTNGPIILSVDNQAHFDNVSSAAINAGSTELWGIGAFQASQPGIYEYFCHYHVSNGMFGYMIVLPNTYCNTHASACNIAGS